MAYEMIRYLRPHLVEGKGNTVFKEGCTKAGPSGTGTLAEMEAFIIIKGSVLIEKKVTLESVDIETLTRRYDEIIWD